MERAFLRYIYKRYCKFEEKSEKVNDIEKGVKKILNEILEEIAKRHSGLSISKVIEGGSFYEKTKVGAPDEFDFMIVLKYLSLPGAIILKDGCVPWYKKVCVEDTSDKYEGVFDHDNLLSNELVTRQFWSRLLSLCKNKTFSVSTQYGTISTRGCKNRKLLLEFRENIPLSDLQENEDDPNSQELIHIPTLEIGVDLMLAIDYPNIEEVVNSEGFPREWRELLENTGCHLVAKTCQSLDPCSTCWHVSLAKAEMKLMLDIGEQHRQAYQVMKYLLIREVPFSGKCANLSSYMLKNAFMFHSHGENRCDEYTRDASVCVHAVFDYLSRNFKIGRMPCFLSRNIDTWGPDLKFPVLSSEKNTSRFLDDGSLGVEWYALCWLELWRRVVVRADNLLKDVESADDNKLQETFYMMKESMMLLVECYCKYTNIQQMSLSEIKTLPKGISDSILDRNFAWYFGRLKELFDVKLGDLL